MKIKNYNIVATLVLLSMLIVSCTDSFFVAPPDDRLTLERTFSKEELTNKFLSNVYSYVPDEHSQRFVSGTAGPWTGGSSEAEYVWSFVESQKVNNGSLDPSSGLVYKYWTEYYRGISKASIFIQNVDKCKEMPADMRKRRKAEARALRAYFYMNLVKIYGPVVIIGEEPIAIDAPLDEVLRSRNSIDECINYVNAEFLTAAADLPDPSDRAQYQNNSQEYGRIIKPIVMAMRSQLWLYAASPLFNGNPDFANVKNEDGKKLFSDFSQAKWDSARIAAKNFIATYVPSMYDLHKLAADGKLYTGGADQKYDPYQSYRESVRGNSFDNTEMVFFRISAGNSGFQYELTPFHSGAPNNTYKGSGGKSVTQEMVDLYFTDKGLRIEDDTEYANSTEYLASSGMSKKAYNNPFNTSFAFAPVNTYKEWVKREPRFYADVTFNNSVWLNTNPSKMVTTTYFNGNSGKAVGGNDYPPTGYIVRKGAPLGDWNAGGRACVLTRLAEIYLNYAEAANECDEYDEAIKYLNLIRQRAGVPEYGTGTDSNGFERIPYTASKDEIRNRIRRERAIELAFENIRYFDVRRWLVADMAVGDGWVYPTYHLGGEGGDFFGLNISQDPPTKFFQKVVIEKRVFEKKHYLFPVPQGEININPRLVQNFGWSIAE